MRWSLGVGAPHPRLTAAGCTAAALAPRRRRTNVRRLPRPGEKWAAFAATTVCPCCPLLIRCHYTSISRRECLMIRQARVRRSLCGSASMEMMYSRSMQGRNKELFFEKRAMI